MSTNFNLLTIKCIAPEKVLIWAEQKLPNGYIAGEIKYAETMNYRTLRPVTGGLFCQIIFGCTQDGVCNCKKKKVRFPVSVDNIQSAYLTSLFFHIENCVFPVTSFLQSRKRWRKKFNFFEPSQQRLKGETGNYQSPSSLIEDSATSSSTSFNAMNSRRQPLVASFSPICLLPSYDSLGEHTRSFNENRLLTQVQQQHFSSTATRSFASNKYFKKGFRQELHGKRNQAYFCQSFLIKDKKLYDFHVTQSARIRECLNDRETQGDGKELPPQITVLKNVKASSLLPLQFSVVPIRTRMLNQFDAMYRMRSKSSTKQDSISKTNKEALIRTKSWVPNSTFLLRPSFQVRPHHIRASFFLLLNRQRDKMKCNAFFLYFLGIFSLQNRFRTPYTNHFSLSYRWYQCFLPFGRRSLYVHSSTGLLPPKSTIEVSPPVNALASRFVRYNLQAGTYQQLSWDGFTQRTPSHHWGVLNRFERGVRELHKLTDRVQKVLTFYQQSCSEVSSVPVSLNAIKVDTGVQSDSNLPLNQYRHLPFCPRCGVFQHSSRKRRYQVGYIDLLFHCSHIWYLKTRPSILSILLDLSPRRIHQIVYLQICLVSRPNYCLGGGEVWNYWSLQAAYKYIFGAYGYGDWSAPWNVNEIKFDFSVSDSGGLSLYRFLQGMNIQKELKRIRCFLKVSGQDARATSIENRSYQTLHDLKDAYPPVPLFPNAFLTYLKTKPIVRDVALYRTWKSRQSMSKITLEEFRDKYPSPSKVGFRRKPFDREKNWKKFVRKNARALIAKKYYFRNPMTNNFFVWKRKEKELLKLNQTTRNKDILEDHVFAIDKDRRNKEFETLIADWGQYLFSTYRTQSLSESHAQESRGKYKKTLSTITSLWVFFHKKVQKKYRDNYIYKVRAKSYRKMRRPKIDPKTFFYTDLYQLHFKWAFIQSLSYRRLRKPLLTATNAFKKPMLWVEHEIRLFRRYKVYQRFVSQSFSPANLLLKYLPVLPPNLRPLMQLDDGNLVSSDLNDLYLFVIRRKVRMFNFLDMADKIPDRVIMGDYSLLQNAVDMLLENGRVGQQEQRTYPVSRLLKSLTDFIKGKQGRFRHNLLGKRVDYSGRSVIVVEPKLSLWECGIPREMAIKLFYPILIRGLIQTRRIRHRLDATRFIQFYTRETCFLGNGNAYLYLMTPRPDSQHPKLDRIPSATPPTSHVEENRLVAFLNPSQNLSVAPSSSFYNLSPSSISKWAGLSQITPLKSLSSSKNRILYQDMKKQNKSGAKANKQGVSSLFVHNYTKNSSCHCYWGGMPFQVLNINGAFPTIVFDQIFPDVTNPKRKNFSPTFRGKISLSYHEFKNRCLQMSFAPLYPSVHRFWAFVQKMIQKHVVLLNRAPTLHRLGIQAFYPRLVPGRAIQLHPLVCPMFNADFDGDQMGVHVPLSVQAQVEAQLLMLSTHNWLSPATGQPSILPSQDMVLGFYYATAPILSPTLPDYFDQFDAIIQDYHSNRFHVHQSLWVACRLPYDISPLTEELYEIHIERSGTSRSVSAHTCSYQESYGVLCHHYLRTTPGRILFNHLCHAYAD